MARSKTDLPRMQNPARSRTPVELGLKVASQTAGRAEKPKNPAAMMRQYDLLERVRRYNPNTDEALLNRAYVYAMKAHGEQKRASGDPYFSHPLEVAAILTDLKLDDATIVAALLHDTIEDTPTTRAEIDKMFGREIGDLVDGVTKLEAPRPASRARPSRPRTCASSAGDRRRRARAAGQARRPPAQHANARAHAGRKGAGASRGDHGDLRAARRPHGHAQSSRGTRRPVVSPALSRSHATSIAERLDALRRAPQPSDRGIEEQLNRKLAEPGSMATVDGRRKRPYSIWRKMERKSVGFEQLSDIFGFRVIVKTVANATARSALCTLPGRSCRAASRTTSRRRSRTTIARSTPR